MVHRPKLLLGVPTMGVAELLPLAWLGITDPLGIRGIPRFVAVVGATGDEIDKPTTAAILATMSRNAKKSRSEVSRRGRETPGLYAAALLLANPGSGWAMLSACPRSDHPVRAACTFRLFTPHNITLYDGAGSGHSYWRFLLF